VDNSVLAVDNSVDNLWITQKNTDKLSSIPKEP
jgi:hypothetical protein